jgi:hypothetical protein
MEQMTHFSREIPATQDAKTLRRRAKRMLELATRACSERNYSFARLLTHLATEVFAHARHMEEARAECAARPRGKPGARRR